MFDVCFLTFSKFFWAVKTVSKKEKREDAVGLTVSL